MAECPCTVQGHSSTANVPWGSTTYLPPVLRLVEPHAPRLRLQVFEGLLLLRDREPEGLLPLDQALHAARLPLRQPPAPAEDAQTDAQPDPQGPEPSAPQQPVHPTDLRRHSGFGDTQRVVRAGVQRLAKRPQLALGDRGRLPVLVLHPAPEPGAQVVHGGSHARTALLSAASGPHAPDRAR